MNICCLLCRSQRWENVDLAHTTKYLSRGGSRPSLPTCACKTKNHPSRYQSKQHLVRQKSTSIDCGFWFSFVVPRWGDPYDDDAHCRHQVRDFVRWKSYWTVTVVTANTLWHQINIIFSVVFMCWFKRMVLIVLVDVFLILICSLEWMENSDFAEAI